GVDGRHPALEQDRRVHAAVTEAGDVPTQRAGPVVPVPATGESVEFPAVRGEQDRARDVAQELRMLGAAGQGVGVEHRRPPRGQGDPATAAASVPPPGPTTHACARPASATEVWHTTSGLADRTAPDPDPT